MLPEQAKTIGQSKRRIVYRPRHFTQLAPSAFARIENHYFVMRCANIMVPGEALNFLKGIYKEWTTSREAID